MSTDDYSSRLTKIFGDLLLKLLEATYEIPLDWIGLISGELGLTAGAAYLANPKIKMMVFEAPYGAEEPALTNLQAAKKKRPDVIFMVLHDPVHPTQDSEHQWLFEEAGADYVMIARANPEEIMEQIVFIATSEGFIEKPSAFVPHA